MTDIAPAASPPDARLLIAPHCAHCPVVLDGLSRLVKEGRIGRLEVINLAVHPEVAETHGVRSVPWLLIGPFTLTGAHSVRELGEWADRAAGGSGLGSYFVHLLETSRLPEVVEHVRASPGSLEDLILLLGDLETPMAVRIGIGAVIEELAGSPALAEAVAPLGALTRAEAHQVRADACHYLGLTDSAEAIPLLTACLEDEDDEVSEIAAESLALLRPADSDAAG